MSPGWSLILALVAILSVVWVAMRIMRKYVEPPPPPPPAPPPSPPPTNKKR